MNSNMIIQFKADPVIAASGRQISKKAGTAMLMVGGSLVPYSSNVMTTSVLLSESTVWPDPPIHNTRHKYVFDYLETIYAKT